MLLFLCINSYGSAAIEGYGSNPPVIAIEDSIEKQILFNGRLWKNQFTGIEGHQFLLSPFSLSGTVVIGNYKFDNVNLRYDILNDELLIQKDANIVVRMNREWISSFDIVFNGELLHFVNLETSSARKLKGYFHLSYDSGIKMYIRYSKDILSESFTNSYPRFNQKNTIFIFKNGEYHKINNMRALFSLLGDKEEQKAVKNFIRNENFRVTVKDPSSVRRVLEYYEKIALQK
jgi:hypothetical protein